jgi:hypothetical protein
MKTTAVVGWVCQMWGSLRSVMLENLSATHQIVKASLEGNVVASRLDSWRGEVRLPVG